MINILKKQIKKVDIRYFLLFLIPTLMVFAYGKYRCDYITKHKDILEFNLFPNSHKLGVDGWSLTHFTLFLVIGFLYPGTFLITMLLGLLWELFETYVGIYKPSVIKGLGFCQLSSNRYKVWWYGKWSDPIVNMLGFLTGRFINKYV